MSAPTTDFFADLDRLRLPAQPPPPFAAKPTGSPPRPKAKKITGEFVKGPIPLPWLATASMLPGKAALVVALAVLFESGRRKSPEVKLTTDILRRFGVNRKAKYSGLKALENAALVRVHREPRRNPVVTILELHGEPDGGSAGQGVAHPEQQHLGNERNGGTWKM